MKLRLQQGLAFVTAVLTYHGRTLTLEQVLVDTGPASTLFAIDSLQALEVRLETWDAIHRIHGVDNTEFVLTKDHLVIGSQWVEGFSIEVRAMG